MMRAQSAREKKQATCYFGCGRQIERGGAVSLYLFFPPAAVQPNQLDQISDGLPWSKPRIGSGDPNLFFTRRTHPLCFSTESYISNNLCGDKRFVKEIGRNSKHLDFLLKF
jgi:hypothetical protein